MQHHVLCHFFIIHLFRGITKAHVLLSCFIHLTFSAPNKFFKMYLDKWDWWNKKCILRTPTLSNSEHTVNLDRPATSSNEHAAVLYASQTVNAAQLNIVQSSIHWNHWQVQHNSRNGYRGNMMTRLTFLFKSPKTYKLASKPPFPSKVKANICRVTFWLLAGCL